MRVDHRTKLPGHMSTEELRVLAYLHGRKRVALGKIADSTQLSVAEVFLLLRMFHWRGWVRLGKFSKAELLAKSVAHDNSNLREIRRIRVRVQPEVEMIRCELERQHR